MYADIFQLVVQLAIAVGTLSLSYAALRQLKESARQSRRSLRLRVLKLLYLYQRRIIAAIERIPREEFNVWDIEGDIFDRYTEEFFSLPKDVQEKLTRISLEYMRVKDEKKSPASMETSIQNLNMMIKKEIKSLVSELQLQSY